MMTQKLRINNDIRTSQINKTNLTIILTTMIVFLTTVQLMVI